MVNTIYYSYIIITFILIHAGLWKIFTKAGHDGWKAIIPFYNYYISLKIVGKPNWWLIWVFIPIINMVIPFLLFVEFCKSFGKDGFWIQTASMLFPYVVLPYIGFKKEIEYLGPTSELKKEKRSTGREWADAIMFALIAATFIRTFFVEPYKIPTPSMEGAMLVGDHLFVSKFHYGARFPMTPIAFPLAHHTMPLIGIKAFVGFVQLPYFRLPALQKVHRNDIVVFNFPEGDTVVINQQDKSYYGLLRQRNGQRFPSSQITVRPVDKMDNYVKRCVAVAGDTFEVRDAKVYINGKIGFQPPDMQLSYSVYSSEPISDAAFTRLDIAMSDVQSGQGTHPKYGHVFQYNFSTTNENIEKIKSYPAILEAKPAELSKEFFKNGTLFPNDPKYFNDYTLDNYGPLVIPKKGVTVKLKPNNISIYRRLIRVYEHNDLEIRNGKLFINGKETDEYTFKYDYYFMMGDNRHNSLDSRYWGFVPETHVVGKPWFVFFSWDQVKGKVRWDRFMKLF
jgi:signal peptidase I